MRCARSGRPCAAHSSDGTPSHTAENLPSLRHPAKRPRPFLGQRLCEPCWMRRRRAPAACPGCTRLKILAFYDDQRRPVCAACTGNPPSFACRSCGREDNPFGSCCATCTLHDRLTVLLSDTPAGSIPPATGLRRPLDRAQAADHLVLAHTPLRATGHPARDGPRRDGHQPHRVR